MDVFRFDWTVDIGQVCVILSFLISAAVFFVRLGDRLKNVESEIKKQTDILIILAKQEETLRLFEKRVDHIESAALTRAA